MKFLSVAGCAVLAFAIAGCVATSDQTPSSETIGTTQQASEHGRRGGGDHDDGDPKDGEHGDHDGDHGHHDGAPLYTFWDPSSHELSIQTCNVVHDPNMDHGAIALHPCTLMFPDRRIETANILVINSFGKVVSDHFVDDRPGGGCIHAAVPDAVSGGTLFILVIGKNIDGDGAHTAFLRQAT